MHDEAKMKDGGAELKTCLNDSTGPWVIGGVCLYVLKRILRVCSHVNHTLKQTGTEKHTKICGGGEEKEGQ